MTIHQALPLLIIATSLMPAILIFFLREGANRARTTLNLGGALLKLGLVLVMFREVSFGHEVMFEYSLMPGLSLKLHADPLSMLLTSLSSILWLLTTFYAIGYLEESPNRRRFFGFFSLCVTTTIGIAMAGNLITLLIFYELLTLTTYPLVVHRGNTKSIEAGRVYLAYTMVGGGVLLVGVIWLQALAGGFDFTATGYLSGMPVEYNAQLQVIFFMLIIGFGVKAAIVPLHGWLPLAMVAPAPVSALLHAVAVVKAGAFGIVRVVYDVYGIEFADELGLLVPLAFAASVTIVYGSIRALFQDDIKRRLAFSTVSQVSYIALGSAIFGPMATVGGIVHLVHQGIMKITLFFCAGNFAETLGIHKVSEMNGVGRRMPLTMGAFTIGALGMIGVPPIAGFFSKWYLGLGGIDSGHYWVIGVLITSSILNAAYFLPVLYRGWFRDPAGAWPEDRQYSERFETAPLLLFPPLATASICILVGVFAGAPWSPLHWARLIMLGEF